MPKTDQSTAPRHYVGEARQPNALDAMAARCGLRTPEWFYQDAIRAPSRDGWETERRSGRTTRRLLALLVDVEDEERCVYVGTRPAIGVYKMQLGELAGLAGVDVSGVEFTTQLGIERRYRGTRRVFWWDHYQGER